MTTDRIKRILILGGGFGGLYTAMKLEKALSGDSSVSVTLVNRENFFLFTPMLHEIAASDLDFTHIVNPIRQLLKRVEFFHGDVQAIDLQSRHVRVFHGPESHLHELGYDYLVIALGSITNYYGIAGLEGKAVAMKALAGDSSVEITLVNRENFFLFTPMLHEIAASDLDYPHCQSDPETSKKS